MTIDQHNEPGHLLDVYGTGGGIQSSLCRYGGDQNFRLVAHGGSTPNATNGVAGAIGLYYSNTENSMLRFHRDIWYRWIYEFYSK